MVKEVFKEKISLRNRPRVQVFFDEPGMTKQSFKDECDVNNLIARYKKTGTLTHVNSRQGQYGDFTNVTDYHSALNQVHAAEESFMSLPASIRSRFENDPGQFIDFIDNPANKDELIKMGLMLDPVQELNSAPKKNSTTLTGSEEIQTNPKG